MNDPVVIAAFVGLVSAIVTSVIASWVGYKKIKADLTGSYRLELIHKQIDACEKL